MYQDEASSLALSRSYDKLGNVEFVRIEAGVPGRAHGLRKAGSTIAANNGATTHQLMAIFGWRTLKMAEQYTRAADQQRLANAAMHMLDTREQTRTESCPTEASGGTFSAKTETKSKLIFRHGAQERVADTSDHSNASLPVRVNCAPLSGKENIQGRPDQQAFPIVIAEWDRNAHEVVRVALDYYNSRHTINARIWYRDGDEVKPSKSGITLVVKHLPALAEAVGKALVAARDLKLLNDGGEQ